MAGGEIIGNLAGGRPRYFLKDHVGSVRTTVDRNGNVVGHDGYCPFGLAMPGRSSNSSNPNDDYKFTAKYAHEQYGGMRGANMLSQPYSVEVRDGNGKALSKNWTLWKDRGSTSSPRWLPCGQWAWDGGLQNGRPKAPAQTECNQLDSGGPR